MDVLVMVGQLILGLSIIVTLHEFGHYATAKYFGMKVEKFFLFFDAWGKKLFSVSKGDTEYGVGWVPLGGYVKISGMIDESMDTEQLNQEPQPWEFRSKPPWQRMIVMVGGVVINLILGILIFTCIVYGYGERYIPVNKMDHGIEALKYGKQIGFQDGDKIKHVNGESIKRFNEIFSTDVILQSGGSITVMRDGADTTINIPEGFANKIAGMQQNQFIAPRHTYRVKEVLPNTPAEEIGLQKGDRIVEVDGKDSRFMTDLIKVLDDKKGTSVQLEIERDGRSLDKEATVTEKGKLGFMFQPEGYETKYYSFFNSIGRGTEKGYQAVAQTLVGLGKVVSGQIDATKAVQGPISIAKNIYGGVWNWQNFWQMTGLLSLVIGIINILPIPALDGGHVMFLIYEAIRGKPVPDNAMKVIQTIGVILLMSLMVFVIFNDIWRAFMK